jgi:two-component sensor histidine kinase
MNPAIRRRSSPKPAKKENSAMKKARFFFGFFRVKSIKARVTIFMLGIFMASIWSLALYIGYIFRSDMRKSESGQQFSTVSLVAGSINEELKTRLDSLGRMAALIPPEIIGSEEATQKYFERFPILRSLFNAGNFIVPLNGRPDDSFPFSSKRIPISGLDRKFLSALVGGKSAISGPVGIDGRWYPIFVMAAPISDSRGRIPAALIGVTDLEKPNFLDIITKHTYGQTGVYMIVSPIPRIIFTASDKNLIMKPLPAPGENPLMDNFCAGFEGSVIEAKPFGFEDFVSVKGIPSAGWFLTVSLPADEAFEPVRVMFKRILIFTIILSLITGFLTWMMLRGQLLPMLSAVELITSQADISAHPDFLPVRDQDEIGRLFSGFNFLLAKLRQREDKIRNLLEEKELILKEVHHRIKNNMNTIKSLLALQAGTLSDPAAIEALEDAGSRVQSMMLLYDNLFQSDQLTGVSAKDYFPPLVAKIVSNFPDSEKVTIVDNIGDFILDARKLQPLGIIVNELITNIMKYAFTGRDSGRIEVTAGLEGRRVSFMIRDDGNGMPDSVDFDNSSGFGLMLVRMLTRQLRGSIRIERVGGTLIILEFDR